MWADIIRDLLAGMEGEWPADENTGVRYPCCLCEHPPGTQAICTDSGPAHTHHDTVDMLGAAVVCDYQGWTQTVRLSGWEVAQVRSHPSGQLTVAVHVPLSAAPQPVVDRHVSRSATRTSADVSRIR